MPRLNSEERARVLAMLECGRTQEQVARRFNVSRSTIRRLVRCVRVTGTYADRPRSGRPRVTSVRQDNFIRQRHLRDRFVTAESTSRVVVGNRGRPISRYTVRRRLRERGITCRRPYSGLVLTLRHRHQRLIWARNHRGQHWSSVYLGILAQAFSLIFPHFSQFFQPWTTFSNFLNILKNTHLNISYDSFIT